MLVYNLVVASKARGESDLPLAKLRPRGSTLGLSTTMDTTGPERGQLWGISQAVSDRHWSVNKHPGLARRPTRSSVAPDQSMSQTAGWRRLGVLARPSWNKAAKNAEKQEQEYQIEHRDGPVHTGSSQNIFILRHLYWGPQRVFFAKK